VSLSAGTSSWTVRPGAGWVVGTVYSPESLRAAQALEAPPAGPDLLELRVDHFAGHPEGLDPIAAGSPRPLIVTVRSAAEGGHGSLEAAQRRYLYERFAPCAHWLDLELNSLPGLAPIAKLARGLPGGLIASHHDFRGGLRLEQLRALAGRAASAGAAICKVAVLVEDPPGVTVLLEFLATETRVPVAVMGMGRYGLVSRLAAAALGSRLNYGYLGDVPQVPGQWPAALLQARIAELRPEMRRTDDAEDLARADDPNAAPPRSTSG
jgi:3-dehydroquinate dehydratase type I